MIEAAVCFFLIALGLGVWAFAALCRRFYSRPQAPGPRPDDSLLAKLFTPESVVEPARVPADPATKRDTAGT